jgi:hypothetical protein
VRLPLHDVVGTQPLWARNGQELFFEWSGALMRVPVVTGSRFEPGAPTKLLDLPPGPDLAVGRMYDVSPDGRRFLILKPVSGVVETPTFPRLIFVQNWFEELKRLVPPN